MVAVDRTTSSSSPSSFASSKSLGRINIRSFLGASSGQSSCGWGSSCAGTALIRRLDWILPAFGVFLIYAAYRMARQTAGGHRPGTEPSVAAFAAFLAGRQRGCSGARPPLLPPPGRPLEGHALLLVLVVIEKHGPPLRRRQCAGHFRNRHRPVYCVYIQRLRHPRPAGVVFPPGRRDGDVPLFALRPGRRAGIRGGKDDRPVAVSASRRGRLLSRLGLLGGDCRHPGDFHRRLAGRPGGREEREP